MKMMILGLLLSTVPALAGEQYLTVTGNSSGFCQGGPMASFCIDQLGQQADREAQQQAQMQCEEMQGNVEFGGNCNHFCNPPMIIEAEQNAFVTCNSNCSVECNTPN